MTAPTATERLEQALSTLSSRACGIRELTVSALCELAEVSRNSLYRYHPQVLAALRQLQSRREHVRGGRSGSAPSAEHRELLTLRYQSARLVALVDHYYAAYRESQALLERREQELAELRRRLDSKPVALTR